MRFRDNYMQLIVLGMHRSGTSVLARLLNLMGAYFGPEGISTGANDENPKGFWERRDVRLLNDWVLHAVGCDWNRVLNFDVNNLPESVVEDFRKKASRLVLEMDAHRPWLLKEPRLCLLLPLWRSILEVPVCVQILRSPVEVAASLLKRNGIPMEAGLALWERYVKSSLEASTGLPRVVVLHRQLMQEPMVVARQLLEQLNAAGVPSLHLPSELEISAFVSGDLYRERESRQNVAPYQKAPQVAFFEFLKQSGCTPNVIDSGMTMDARKALADYESGLPPLNVRSEEKSVPRSELVLRGQLALREQETDLLKKMSSRLDSELKQRNTQLAFFEAEFKAVREFSVKQIDELKNQLIERDGNLAILVQDLRLVRESSAKLESELGRANKELETLGDELKSVEAARTIADRSVSERFEEVEQLTRILLSREQELEGIDKERKSALTALSSREAELAAQGASLALSKRKLAVVSADNKNLKRQVLDGEVENARLRSLISANEVEIKRRDDRLNEITDSISWRLGAPLRAVRRLFRFRDIHISTDLNTIRKSAYFDTAWYLERNRDVAKSGMDPAEHYLKYGASEGRDPGPEFDSKFYLINYVDVAASNSNPLVHYMRHGKAEGRSVKASEDNRTEGESQNAMLIRRRPA